MAGLWAVIAVTTLMVIYALLPHGAVVEGAKAAALIIGVVLFIALAVWQVYRVVNGRFPKVRTAESLTVGFALVLRIGVGRVVTRAMQVGRARRERGTLG